jgi:hypothetical protein
MHTFATRALMAAMAALGLGITLDVLLVAEVVLDDRLAALVVAGALLATFTVAWCGLPLMLRANRHRQEENPRPSNLGQPVGR